MPPPPERRSDPRFKVKAPVEIYLEGNDVPLRTATADLSLHGCYIESFSPFPIGTDLELKLQANSTLLVMATVVTKDPQVGNGILHRNALRRYRGSEGLPGRSRKS